MKFTKFILSLLIVGPAVSLQTCSPEEDMQTVDLEIFQQKTTELGINLFKCAEQSFPNNNLIFSPYDAQLALSMAANLLDTSFRNQVCEMLGYNNVSNLNATNKFIIDQLTVQPSEDKGLIFVPTKISNSVWSNNEIASKRAKAISKYYYADVNKVNLNSEKGVSNIKEWMKSSRIKGLKRSTFSVPENTDLAIFSHLYFNQEWASDYHFSESYRDTFYTSQGEQPISFMNAEINARYLSSEKFQSVILQLSKYQMICVLPTEDTHLSEAINNFEAADLRSIIDNSEYQDILLSMPVFKFNKQLDLNPLLKKCGINISSPKVIFQQASTIEVDQTGIAAGSVTCLYVVLSYYSSESPIALKLNRPFMFFIVDRETKIVLFAGQCVGPK